MRGRSPLGQLLQSSQAWIRDRLESLAGLFGLEIAAFAVLSNHLHVILPIRPDVVALWSDPLDDGRFHWFHVSWWGCVVGYTLLIPGMVGLTLAESVNKFFEQTVRIQTDRGHRVIDAGPYAIVRHPGYVSACILFMGMPLALGSLWALIPAVLSCLLLVLRTIWEDRTLRDELAGYEEHTQRVRYRLIPGV